MNVEKKLKKLFLMLLLYKMQEIRKLFLVLSMFVAMTVLKMRNNENKNLLKESFK